MSPTWLDLYDYRRRVAVMYRERESAFRAGEDELSTLRRFRSQKDALYKQHPQSPLAPDDRLQFGGLRYYPYNPDLRVEAVLEPAEGESTLDLPASGQHNMLFRRAAVAHFEIEGKAQELAVYWLDVYGGGLFLPFRDATCPDESYGGGRYLFDTVKGSDFIRLDGAEGTPGYTGGRVLLDFNYAYNPSCAYSPHWVCPLAPSENRLHVPIMAGELKYHE